MSRDNLLRKILVAIMAREGKEFMEADGNLSYHGFKQDIVDAYYDQQGMPRKDVRDLKFSEQFDIFKNGYYNTHLIKNVPDEYLPYVMDFAFNSGPKNAAKTLQEMVGLKGDDVDALIGDQTLGALQKFTGGDVNRFVEAYSDARIDFIDRASATNDDVDQFRNGIINRINGVRTEFPKIFGVSNE